MAVEYTIISIGTLSHNSLWGEGAPVRTSHATTTLIRTLKKLILVDPSLPSPALEARFFERTGKTLAAVTDVFCTTLRPVHRRNAGALAHANWWASELEIEHFRGAVESLLDSAERLQGDDIKTAQADLKVLQRFKPAPEKFDEQVSLYPLPGPTLGHCGLLLTPAASTIVIAGDAALTAEHLLRGQVWEGCHDTEQAMESLKDLLEIADVIVPGHDNLMLSPQRYL